MKTNQEIQGEARDIVALSRNFLSEQPAIGNSAAQSDERMRFQFPTNLSAVGNARHIEAAMVGGAIVFRLIEREPNGADSKSEVDYKDTLVASSPSAYDMLKTGYEMAEEERLARELEPYAERSEESISSADDESVSQVEVILDSKALSPADRLRTKAEIVEFIEGRLEPSELITRNIERQCAREHLAQQREQKITVGTP